MTSFHIIDLDETGSTNDEAKRLAQEGGAHGTVLCAKRQTAGRGRQGNSWDSLDGNLLMSVVLKPDVPLVEAGQLSFVIAVALGKTLLSFDMAPTLKWPNDVLVDGKKIAGILIESEIQDNKLEWVVVGIGLNIAAAPEGATCLEDISGTPHDVSSVRDMLLTYISETYKTWLQEGFMPIRKAWLRLAQGMGEELTARLPTETLNGIFRGLDETGALLLDIGDGDMVKITAGEVFFG